MPVSAHQIPLDTAKAWAKRLARFTRDSASPPMKLHQAQAAVATMLGFDDWHALTLHLAQPVKLAVFPTPPPLGSPPTTREEWEGLWHSLLQNEDHIAIHFEKRPNDLKIRVRRGGSFTHGWAGCSSTPLEALLAVTNSSKNIDLFPADGRYEKGALNPATDNPKHRLRYQRLPVFPEGMDLVITRAAMNSYCPDATWFPHHQQLLLNATHLTPGLFAVVGTTRSGRTSLACHLIETLAARHSKSQPPLKILGWLDDKEQPLRAGKTLRRGQSTLAELQKHVESGLDILFIDDLLNPKGVELIQRAVEKGTTVFVTMHCASEQEVPMRLADFCGEEHPGEKVRALKLQLSIYLRLLPLLCLECSKAKEGFRENGKGCVFCGNQGTSGQVLQAEAVTWDANQESTKLWPHRSHVNDLIRQGRVSVKDAEDLLGSLDSPNHTHPLRFEDIPFEHNGQM